MDVDCLKNSANSSTDRLDDSGDIGKKENGLNKTNDSVEDVDIDMKKETSISIKEEKASQMCDLNENKNQKMEKEIDILKTMFPEEMLLEEQRLTEEHSKDDESTLLETLDEKEKKKRFQNLLVLLESSTRLTHLFEARIKQCKRQIIKKEMNKVKKLKENENINDEDYYINLFQQPKLFNGTLKAHQIEGLLWIRTLFENGLNGILADDMGLGKTIQTIAFYCFLIEMGIPGPFLVIAPLSTIPNWLSEFAKFSPQLKTLLYHGLESDRIKYRLKIKSTAEVNGLKYCPIVITTYEIIRYDIKYLKTVDWKYITIDEGHKLKSFNNLISKNMRLLKCSNKLILTGTPIQNNMSELWSLLNLLMPNLFDKLEDFNSWFVIEDFFGSNNEIASMAKKDEILNIMLKILKPFILRREKKETDLNLPPKKEIVVYAPLTETQQKLYKATLNKHLEILLNEKKEIDYIHESLPKRKCVERIERYTDHNAIMKCTPEQEVESKTFAISVVMVSPWIQLKKIASHPYLVHMPLIPGTNKILVDENIVKASGKFQVLDAILAKLKLRGHKVLLFSTMTQILDVIEEFLILRSYKYARLDGTMMVERRVDEMKVFNTDPNCFIMIISTRAGGLGLNLTAADTVIIFDSDWNPQCDLQAQDRCHRMGQDKPVVVYRLCSKNTIDEQILKRATAKRKLEKILMGNGIFNRVSKLDIPGMEELMALLESSDYNKKIQSNGFIFTDEELDAFLDRSDMVKSAPTTNITKSAEHFKVLNKS